MELNPIGQSSSEVKKAWLGRNQHRRSRISRDSRFRREYGISPETFEQMLKDQDNRCAICKVEFATESDAHVDHDHRTRWVRGILCSNCNCAIGLMAEDVERFSAAMDYLILNTTPTEFSFQRVPTPPRAASSKQKKAVREANLGNKHRQGKPAWNKGKPWSEGSRRKMSESAKRRVKRGVA